METVERRLGISDLRRRVPLVVIFQPSTDGHLSLAVGVRASSWSEHSPSVPGLCAAGQPHLVQLNEADPMANRICMGRSNEGGRQAVLYGAAVGPERA